MSIVVLLSLLHQVSPLVRILCQLDKIQFDFFFVFTEFRIHVNYLF